MKTVNQNNIVKEIVATAGVSKENAVKIFNLFSNVWTQDRIGLLKALDVGIKVRKAKKRVVRNATSKKKVKVKTPTATETVKTEKIAKTKSSPVATVKTKLKKKKAKKLKVQPTQETTTTTSKSV